MNDLKDTKTADLIAEWSLCKRAITYISNRESSHGGVWQRAKKQRCINETERIATELDRRCSDAGIALIEGQFHYARKWFSVVLEDGEHLLREVCCAEYSHQYREWLLLKEGGGNA